VGKAGRIFLTIFGIVVIYGLLNLVLVGAQTWMHKDENARLDYLEKQIQELEEGTTGKEDWLMERRDELEKMYNRGEELALYLDDLTASYPDGFPEDVYQEFLAADEEYQALTAEYEELYAEFEDERQRYDDALETYNTVSDEYEDLAEEVSMWVLIPGFKKGD
jgi:septation ring formation regulator EzrA